LSDSPGIFAERLFTPKALKGELFLSARASNESSWTVGGQKTVSLTGILEKPCLTARPNSILLLATLSRIQIPTHQFNGPIISNLERGVHESGAVRWSRCPRTPHQKHEPIGRPKGEDAAKSNPLHNRRQCGVLRMLSASSTLVFSKELSVKKTLLILLILIGTVTASAQSPVIEYGEPSELNAISKIYINTGMDFELHQKIAKDIQKKLPNLIICDKPEDAEVFLVFNTDSETFLAGVSSTTTSQDSGYLSGHASTYGNSTTINGTYSGNTTSTTTTSPFYRKVETGIGHVFKRIGQNRFRVMMSFKDSRKWRFERKPRSNFAREFVEAYSKANEDKKGAERAQQPQEQTREQSAKKSSSITQPAAQSSVPILNAEGYNQEGMKLFSQQKIAEAEAAFREAVRLDTDNALYHHNLGTVLNARQKYGEAEKEVELAVRLAPNEEIYRKNLEIIRANRRH